MLIDFSVTNFLSFASTQTLSMVAGSLEQNSDNACFKIQDSEYLKKLTLLKSAVIYGANASGKSNLLKSLSKMKLFVLESTQRGEDLELIPFKLNAQRASSPSEFEVNFIADNVRYQYGFTATSKKVHEEWLFAFPKAKAQKWFTREWSSSEDTYFWSFGSAFSGEKQTWKNATRDNALFLSTAIQLNNSQLKPIVDWFKNLKVIEVDGYLNPQYSANYCDQGNKYAVLSFLQNADIGIDTLEVSKEKFDPVWLPNELPRGLKAIIVKDLEDSETIMIITGHKTAEGNIVYFGIDEESTGTQRILSFAVPWLESLNNGHILCVDELHSHLHPKLVGYLVELFHNPKTNPKNAQLIFTTHETSILNQEVFRRDQVWFTEKNGTKETILMPLSDFKPRKGRENLEASYLSGRYGSTPYIKEI